MASNLMFDDNSLLKLSSEGSSSLIESCSLETPKSVTLEFDGNEWFVEELPLLSDDSELDDITGPITLPDSAAEIMLNHSPTTTVLSEDESEDPHIPAKQDSLDESAAMRNIPIYRPSYHPDSSTVTEVGGLESAGSAISATIASPLTGSLSVASVGSHDSSLSSEARNFAARREELIRSMSLDGPRLPSARPVSRVMTNAAVDFGSASDTEGSTTSLSDLAEQLSRIYGRTPMEEFRFRKKCPRLGIPPQPYVCHRCGGRDHFIEACQSTKSSGPRATPPDNYVCHKCNTPGHWISDCPLNRLTSLPSRPPVTYVCHNCGIPGHWIKDCPLPLPESRQRSPAASLAAAAAGASSSSLSRVSPAISAGAVSASPMAVAGHCYHYPHFSEQQQQQQPHQQSSIHGHHQHIHHPTAHSHAAQGRAQYVHQQAQLVHQPAGAVHSQGPGHQTSYYGPSSLFQSLKRIF